MAVTERGVSELSNALYTRCKEVVEECEELYKKIFTQNELLELCDSPPLDTVKSGLELLPLVTELTQSKLFLTYKSKTGSTWSLRRDKIALQLRSLTRDEYMVYEIIEEASDVGIWVKNIKKKSGINDGKSMEKFISKLARTHMIKSVRNVKAPAQKTYMLSHLAPSDDVTGGSFYDAGDLDESLVEELSNIIVFHVRAGSWVEVKKRKIKKEKNDVDAPIIISDEGESFEVKTPEAKVDGKKRKRDSANTTVQSNDIEDLLRPKKYRSPKHTHDPEVEVDSKGSTWLLHPAGHKYPTTESIYKFIMDANFLASVKADTISVDEIQNILNVLVWDGKLERVNGGYRTVRGVEPRAPNTLEEEEGKEGTYGMKRGNGLTEMPCGRCPVLELCAPGALISAASCAYFEEWLNDKAPIEV